ncbi:MAG: TonB-dependent receptor plug domain-containing protein, partial [Pseudomonadota bacterium]
MSAVSKRRALQGASLAALSAAFVQPAAAQDRGFVPDEILVTAQKREERAFDVPIPVVSYDKGFFDTAGIQDIEELSEFVPGLNVQIQSANNPSYVIRGITSDDASTQQPPRVSVYYNGVDISRARGSNFEVFDLDRVEVVKGPQATLFGTAALTGAISVITAKPEKEFSAEAYAGYGADDYTKVGGFVTAGTDTVQGRLAGQYRRRDGYIENLAPGEDDLQGFDVFALRPSFAFTPVDELRVDVVFTYETHDSPGVGFKSGVIAPPGGDTSPFTPAYLSGAFDNATAGSGTAQNGLVRYDGVVTTPGGGFTTSLTPLPNGTVENQLRSNSIGLDRDVYDVSITTEWKIDDTWTLTGIFGYRDYENLETFDADGSVVPLIEISENSSGDQMTGELRFNIDNGSRLKSFFGFNAFVEDAERALPQVVDEAIF